MTGIGFSGRRNGSGAGRLLCGTSLSAILLLAVPSAAFAQDANRNWDANSTTPGSGGTGTWNTSGLNWSPNTDGTSGPYSAPWDNSLLDNAIFGSTAGTVTLGAPITVHDLTFNTDGYTLTGNTLTLSGVSPTITVNTAATGRATISSVIAGTNGLTKAGAGVLFLDGVNIFSGGITLSGGRLWVNNDAAFGAASNMITTTANAQLSVDSGSTAGRVVTIGAGTTLTIDGAGAGSARFTGSGNLAAFAGMTLSNDNSDFTGTTTLNGFFGSNGSIYFTSVGNVGEASSLGAGGTITFTRGDLTLLRYIGDGDSSNRDWVMAGSGARRFLNEGTGTLNLSGDIELQQRTQFQAATAGFDLQGVISGVGSAVFTGSGAGTITLAGANSFTGATDIGGGVVSASVLADTGMASSLGAGSQVNLTDLGVLSYTGTGGVSNRTWTSNGRTAIHNNGDGTLALTGDLSFVAGGTDTLTLGGNSAETSTFSGAISGTGGLVKEGTGTWVLSGNNSYTGTTMLENGTLRAGSATAFNQLNSLTVNGGTLDLAGFDYSFTRLDGTGGTVALGSGNLTVNAATGISPSFAGSITGTGGLTKLGAGTLTLSGASTYSGATTVGGGTLVLDFSPAGGPASNILSGTSALSMGGGILTVTGAAGEANSQSFNGLTITGGNNTISSNSGSAGSLTLNLGAITRTGGLANFVLPTAGAITTTNGAGALGGWATVNGTDYAKVVGGSIVAFADADYTDQDDASLWANGQFISDSDGDADSFFGTVGSSVQLGGLQFTTPDATTTVTVAGGQTLGVDGTIIVAPSVLANNQTITGGSLTGMSGGGVLGVQQNSTGTLAIASQIVDNSGAIGFTKSGTGRVVLSNSNSYTGATIVAQGTLSVNSIGNGGVTSAVGASTADASNLVIQGGTLEYTGGTATTDRGFTLTRSGATTAGTISVTNAATNLTFSGQVTSPDGAGLTKIGGGTLTLTNAGSDYTGITTISGGTLAISSIGNGGTASTLGASSSASTNLVLQSGGELEYTGGTASTDRGFTLGAGGGAVDVAQGTATLTMSGVAAGSGALSKNGAGTLLLSGINTYSGGTTVNNGILRAGSTQAFGTGTMTVNAGGTLDVNNQSLTIGSLAGSGTVTNLGTSALTLSGGTSTFSGVIGGSGALIRTGPGFQTFSGCNNTYTGATIINNGTMSTDCLADGGFASGIGASGNASSNLVFIGGRLTYTGASVSIDRGFTLESGSNFLNVNDAAASLEFEGVVTGAGALNKEGAGTLVLSGTNTYTGNIRVFGGVLRAGADNAFGPQGYMTLDNTAGVLLDLNDNDAVVTALIGGGANGGNVDLGSGTLTIAAVDVRSYAGAISGTGDLVMTANVNNAGRVQELTSCSSTYDGTTTVTSGVLAVSCLTDGGLASSIGDSSNLASNLVLNGGTLRYIGTGGSTDRLFTLGSSANSKVEASGTGAIAFTNTGAIAFASPDTAQTIRLGGTNTANNSFALQIADNGSGLTSFTKEDAGTWILTNTGSTYSGVTSILGGVLGVDKLADGGQASSIGRSGLDAANLVIGSGATLRYTGAGDSTNRLFTLQTGVSFIESSGSGAIAFTNNGTMGFQGSGTRIFALGGTNSGANIMGVSITDGTGGSTTVAKNDSGNWYLTGTNAYTGPTNVNAGTLFIGNGGTTGSITSSIVNVTGFGALGFNRSDMVTYTGTIQGSGGVTQAGTGTTILTGANTYTGGTTISAGTLQLGNGGTSGSIVGNVVNNGTLAFNRSGTVGFAGQISGSGAVHQTGPGVLALSGVNSYAGGTVIDGGGTLQITADANLGAAAGSITFDDGTLQVRGPVVSDRDIILDGNGTINIDTSLNAGTSWTNAGDITGSGSLTKIGLGRLILTGNATHSGGTTVSQNILQIGDGGTSGSIAGDIFNNNTVAFNRSDSYTYAGSMTGPGSLQLVNGTLTLTGDSSVGNISTDANTELRITAGNTVSTTGITTVGGSTLTISGAGSTLEAQRVNALTASAGSTINVEDGGTLRTTGGPLALAPTIFAAGPAVLNVTGAGSLVDLAGALTAANGTNVASTAVVNVSAGGTIRSTGANVIGRAAGNTTGPDVTISGTGSNWTSTGTLALNSGDFSLLAGGAASFASATIGSADEGADLLVSGANSIFTTTGDLVIGTAPGGTDAASTGTVTLANGGRLRVGGTLTLAGDSAATGNLVIGSATGAPTTAGLLDAAALVFGPGTGSFSFNHTGTNYGFAAAMSGAGSIFHSAGVTRLTGDSSAFTGTTAVSGGTLLVDGTLGSAASVTNVLGGTLGGTGTIGGDVTVGSGAILAAGGDAVGTLMIGGNLDLSSPNTILNFQLGQANVPGGALNDLVNVGGDLNLNGQLNVTTSPGGTFGPGVYRLFNYGGALSGSGLTNAPSGTFVQTAVAGQVNLANTAGLTLNIWDGATGPKNDGAIQGGSGIWRIDGGANNWTDVGGLVNADYAQNSFAIFQGTGGAVIVDASGGAVQTAGMQFTADGYNISGAPLELTGAQAFIRVGDGSAGDAGLTATIGSALTGASQLVKTDSGTLVLSGTNSYTGGTAINGGTLRISSNANLGDFTGGLSFNGGTLHAVADVDMIRTIDLAGAGTIDADAAFVTLRGVISGGGTLTKEGNGTLALLADNSYTGGTTIAEGILQVGNGGTTGSILGDVINNGSLLFARSNSVIFGGTISGSGTVVQNGSGVLTLTADNSYTGVTTIRDGFNGALQLGNGGTTGSVAGDVANGGTLIFNRSNEYGFAGTISGTGDVRHEGTGTTILTAANSYAGSTIISRGTLLINGDQTAATGTTNVLGGGALGGIGTIGGDVFVGGAATLTPGDATGPGTLTINGNLGFSPNATLAYDFGQSNVVGGPLNDLTEVAGDLALDGTIDVTLSPGGSFGPGLYRVISYGGALTDNGLDVGTMPAGSTVAVQTSVGGQINLVNAAGGAFNFWDGAAGANESNNLVDGGDGTWQNASGNNDWTTTDGAVSGAYTDGAFAIFAAAAGTVAIDNGLGAVTASGLQFASDGYTITGENLTLVGPESVIRVGDGTAAGLGMTATIDSRIFGDTQLVKADLGTLELTRANSYTGGTRIDAGTLRISSDAQLGDAAGALSLNGGTLNTTVAVASGRAVNLLGTGTLLTDVGSSLTLFGSVTGAGGFTKAGTGILVLTGNNSFGGDVDVTAGQMFVNGDQSASTGATRVASGATLSGSGIIGGDVTLADGATLDPGGTLFGVGTLEINGNLALSSGSALRFQFGEANVAGGALNDLVNVDGDLTLDGTVDVLVPTGGNFAPGIYRMFNYGGSLIDNGLALGTLPGGSAVSVQTAVAGQVNLVNTAGLALSFWDGNAGPKNDSTINGGNGIWRVAGGSNNWTDATGSLNADYAQDSFAIFAGAPGVVTIDDVGGNVEASGLQFASDGYRVTGDALTLTGSQAIVQVGDSSAASAAYTAVIESELTGSAGLVKTDAGRLILTGDNSYTGGTAINGGTLRISSDANLGAAAGGLSLNGGTLSTAADMSSARAVTLAGAGTFLTDAGTTLTLSGVVSGAGSLIKNGAGTLALTGIGNYAGATHVAGGTLLVNGDFAGATGATSVASGASLGGTGTIAGNVTLADGATLTPGAGGAGTLTIGGNLSLAAGTTLAYEFGQAGTAGGSLNDLVNVAGDLVLDGTINVAATPGGAFDIGVYRVFNYGGTLTNNGLAVGTLPGGTSATVQTSIAGQVNLVNSAGLTLGFWDGAAGPKNNGVINGGSGTWQNSAGNDYWTDASGNVNAAYSDGAFAVFGGTGGTVTVDNSLGQVTAAGMQFAANGYTIAGNAIALTEPQSTIRVGDGSTAGAGFTATINAVLSGDTQLVKTDAGTLILGGANSYTGGTLIDDGTVQISADANLGAAAGDVTLDGGTLATSANVTSARDIVLAGAGTISTAADTVMTYNGLFSGTGSLTKAGAGTLLVTADNSGFGGSMSVAAGTLAVHGSLGGAVNVGASGRLEGAGRVGSVVNAGIVAPGSSIGSLTVAGDYTSNGGVLEIEAELGADNSLSDRLIVGGATSGSTRVTVTNRGGLGAQTIEGIKIVDVAGASNGSFILDGDYLFDGEQAVIAGAYGYRLYKNGVATPQDGDWYLRSALLNGSNVPQGPLYQPGVPLYENYGQVLASLNTLPTLQERVGHRQWARSEDGASTGIWGRMESTRARPEARVSTAGTDANIDSWKLQIGADRTLSESDNGTLVAGITGHYGESNASVRSMFGNGTIKANAYGAGATLTWYSQGGFYADAQAQFAWFDGRLTSSVLGTLVDDNGGAGKAFSLELGKRAAVGGGLTVTPQVQMSYQDADFDSFADPSEAMVSSAKGDSLKTRWGISLDHQKEWESNGRARRSHLYGLINVSCEWLDGAEANVSGTAIRNANDRLRGEIALGGSLGLGGRVTLYTQASASSPFRDFGDDYSLKGVAGVRVAF